MPEFRSTLRDPDGATHVVGNATDEARLRALGYEVVDEPDTDGGQAAANATPTEPVPAERQPAPVAGADASRTSAKTTKTTTTSGGSTTSRD